MRHHHWLYGSLSYWPQPINGLNQCKTKQISPATPDLISIIHCPRLMVWPHNTAIVIFVTNQYSSNWSFFNWAQQHWASSSRGLFASFPLKLSCYEYSSPRLQVSHRVPLSLACRHQDRGKLCRAGAGSSSQSEIRTRVTWLLSSNERARRRRPNPSPYAAHRLNCSYFGLHGRNFWYINNVVDDLSGDYYK